MNSNLLFGALISGSVAMPASANDYPSRLCIERPGENGLANITPVTIKLKETAELTILGEQEVCIGLDRAKDTKILISLKFSNPYGDPHKKLEWETTPKAFPVKAVGTIRLLLCERQQGQKNETWEKSGWHDMWMLVPPKDGSLCQR